MRYNKQVADLVIEKLLTGVDEGYQEKSFMMSRL